MRIARTLLFFTATCVAVSLWAADAQESGMTQPNFDGGKLLRPEGWQSWTHLGTATGLSYSKSAAKDGPGTFGSVYVQPQAYAQYVANGTFPEGAMFALEVRAPAPAGSIAKGGYTAGDLVGFEISVKDSKRFEGGWAYFGFGGREGLRESAEPFPKDSCFQCHSEHAADDNVFVQYYSRLREAREAAAR
jgi:hypothetical protein